MTPEEKQKREYQRRQAQRRQIQREQNQRQLREADQIKKRRKRTKAVFYAGMLGLSALCFFFLGKTVGKMELLQALKVSVSGEELLGGNTGSMEGRLWKEDGPGTEAGEGILLVNKDNPLPEDYEAELLILPDGVGRAAKEAYEPLCSMLNAGREEGLNFEICSSYRSPERQQELFDEDLEQLIREGYSYLDAYEEVARETMPPGCSEHSTGLAFDIVALDYQMLDAGQERTAENRWLRAHCAEYGFILRYPEGAEEITGISYESWHFRYVGVEAAQEIAERGITLEEYLGDVDDRRIAYVPAAFASLHQGIAGGSAHSGV